MYERAKQFTLVRPRLKKIVGVTFIVFGIIALITPFTPGAAFMLALGCELLGLRVLFAERLNRRQSGVPEM